jgi:hypothetical protein
VVVVVDVVVVGAAVVVVVLVVEDVVVGRVVVVVDVVVVGGAVVVVVVGSAVVDVVVVLVVEDVVVGGVVVVVVLELVVVVVVVARVVLVVQIVLCTHCPFAGLQESWVHGSPSSQVGGGPPTHTPPEQLSMVVQGLPSSHGPATGVCVQPVLGSQPSAVQGFRSSQFFGTPGLQLLFKQVSFSVQALPSSQGALLATCIQPRCSSQLSSVQTLWSSQSAGVPATQCMSTQVSRPSQMFPSSQSPSLTQQFGTSWCTQPSPGAASSHESMVQGAPSSQFGGVPGWQPLTGSHVSTPLQGLPSLHWRGVPPTHVWFTHVSMPSQTFPLSHCASLVQQPSIEAVWQPVCGSQLTVMQAAGEPQSTGSCTQSPEAGSQLSVLQASLSSQPFATW